MKKSLRTVVTAAMFAAAKNLDKALRFTVKDADGNVVYDGEYSAFSYVLNAMNKSTDAKLLDLVKSMVVYNQAAKAYFGK